MRANELRIGNKLLNDGVVVTIDARTIFDIWDDKGMKKYKPIPLNDSWISKFDDPKKGDFAGIFKHNQSRDINGYFLWIGGYKRYIKYVHDYQNLYFVLTEKEIEVSEE